MARNAWRRFVTHSYTSPCHFGEPLFIVPEPEELFIKQGNTSDCRALTAMYGPLELAGTVRAPAIYNAQGYALAKDSKRFEVNISREKLNMTLGPEQGTANRPRASSNSLFVLVMEHVIGNLVRKDADACGLDASFDVHSDSGISAKPIESPARGSPRIHL